VKGSLARVATGLLILQRHIKIMKKNSCLKLLGSVVAFAVLGSVCENAQADVKLPAFFSDGMVLQCEIRVPIWGTADAGEAVSVSVAGHTAKTVADTAGKWKVELAPLKVGSPLEITVKGKNSLTLHDVLVGEVWIGSGQSNMQMSVRSSANAAAETAAANYPRVRMFTVKTTASLEPLTDVIGKWSAATPEAVGSFSAIGYFFSRQLHQKLGVPVGFIHTSWGGTPAEAWTREAVLRADEYYKTIFERWERVEAAYPEAKKTYDVQLAEWTMAAAAAKAEGKPEPKKPVAPTDPNGSHRPGALYNGMIAPLVPYAMRCEG
jgi:sialate O-acetylesterase